MSGARQAAKVTEPPWGATERSAEAELPDGSTVTAGEAVKVAGRPGDWTFLRGCTTAKSTWLDVARDGRVVPVAADTVTVVRRKRAVA